MQFIPDLYTFLTRHFGLSVEFLDLDGEDLSIDLEPISREDVLRLLATEYRSALVTRVRHMQRSGMNVFVGGPLAGQRHADHGWPGKSILIRLGPARWAAYVIGSDFLRAWFCGDDGHHEPSPVLAWRSPTPLPAMGDGPLIL
jgi:hypothetical protein